MSAGQFTVGGINRQTGDYDQPVAIWCSVCGTAVVLEDRQGYEVSLAMLTEWSLAHRHKGILAVT